MTIKTLDQIKRKFIKLSKEYNETNYRLHHNKDESIDILCHSLLVLSKKITMIGWVLSCNPTKFIINNKW